MGENQNVKPINLLAVSTAKNTNEILSELIKASQDKILLKLHLGDSASDFKASSLVRMNAKPGSLGHLFNESKKYSGVDLQLMASESFRKDLETLIDQLFRHSNAYRYKSHNLQNLQDYLDYYHILADAIADKMLANDIDHVLFFNIPHLAYDTIIYQIARSLEIETTIVTQSLFPNNFFSLREVEHYGEINNAKVSVRKKTPEIPELELFYMKKIKQKAEKNGRVNVKTIINLILFIFFKNPRLIFRPIYLSRILTRIHKIYKSFPKWRDPFANFFHVNELAYFEHLAEFETTNFDLNERFVYFPLPMQPEMTTSAIGGAYRDQLLALEHLSKILPKDVKIFVKENPKQGSFARGPLFFHRISRIKSVTFVPSFADTNELTRKALFIATVTGTVGWESLCLGKSVLVFGHAWYRDFPGVTQFSKQISFEKIINNIPKKNDISLAFGRLIERAHKGVIDRAYTRLAENYNIETNKINTAKILTDLILKEKEVTFTTLK